LTENFALALAAAAPAILLAHIVRSHNMRTTPHVSGVTVRTVRIMSAALKVVVRPVLGLPSAEPAAKEHREQDEGGRNRNPPWQTEHQLRYRVARVEVRDAGSILVAGRSM